MKKFVFIKFYIHFVDCLQTTKILRSKKSTIGPVFVTVTPKPNQLFQRQVLIKFNGPPDTSVSFEGRNLTKVQGKQSLNLISLTFFLSIIKVILRYSMYIENIMNTFKSIHVLVKYLLLDNNESKWTRFTWLCIYKARQFPS